MKKDLIENRRRGGNSLIRHIRHSLKDMRHHSFLHGVAWITIVLTVVMSGTFALFASNTTDVISSWEAGVKVMAYLENGLQNETIAHIKTRLENDPDVVSVQFISREKAMESLRARMQRHATILEDLPENPLPNAFELYVKSSSRGWQLVEAVAARVAKMEGVEDVESGGQWIGRLLRIVTLFRASAYGMGALFFLVAVFIVSNTIRLAFYSRKEEVEIMRLVGATEGFIKAPFYIQSVILGLTGGLFGVLLLYLFFWGLTLGMDPTFNALAFSFHFLSLSSVLIILGLCVMVGLMGAYFSFRQEVSE